MIGEVISVDDHHDGKSILYIVDDEGKLCRLIVIDMCAAIAEEILLGERIEIQTSNKQIMSEDIVLIDKIKVQYSDEMLVD